MYKTKNIPQLKKDLLESADKRIRECRKRLKENKDMPELVQANLSGMVLALEEQKIKIKEIMS